MVTITTEPNEEAAQIHDRIPVMLEGEGLDRFPDPELLTVGGREKGRGAFTRRHPESLAGLLNGRECAE